MKASTRGKICVYFLLISEWRVPLTRWENLTCPIWLGSEQPSCFSCLIILGLNFWKIWATAQNVWSGYKQSAEFHLISQYCVILTWDVNHFSGQAAKEYVILGHGVKGSLNDPMIRCAGKNFTQSIIVHQRDCSCLHQFVCLIHESTNTNIPVMSVMIPLNCIH